MTGLGKHSKNPSVSNGCREIRIHSAVLTEEEWGRVGTF